MLSMLSWRNRLSPQASWWATVRGNPPSRSSKGSTASTQGWLTPALWATGHILCARRVHPEGPDRAARPLVSWDRCDYLVPLAAVLVIRNRYGASRVSTAPVAMFEITTVKLSFVEHWVNDWEMVEPLNR